MNLATDRQQEHLPEQRLPSDDIKFATGKIAFIQYLTVAVFLFLISGFWELQIRNYEVYHERAEQNSIKSIPVLAARGKILDRDGRVIVDNHGSYTLILSHETLKEEHLKPIAMGLNLDYEALTGRVHRFNAPKYVPIVIKEELTPGELAFVESHRDSRTFPEMDLIRAQRRLYPKDGTAAHVIGYVGEVSENELNTPELAKFHPGDVIGKEGIERQYNDILMGTDGKRQVEVDSIGKERRILENVPDVPGQNLELTLDLDLQVVSELAMENRRGAVVALDPRSGEVLAMVSRPAFDPNIFAARIKNSDWKVMMNDPGHPLLNRAIQAQLAPGSTFKPIMAVAGLETGAIDDSYTVNCSGGASFYGRYFKCHEVDGHTDLHKAIVKSCDVFFYNVGNKLGIDNIAHYAELAGLGHRTGIDLPHEAEGTMPSTKWKARTLRQKWYAGETISVSIGQGYVTVTPLQIAAAIGGIATGGNWPTPHVVKNAPHLPPTRHGDFKSENVEKVVSGMYGVVNEGGTGARAKLPGLDVCGKTGTAQLASNQLLKGTRLGKTMKDTAWFVGFAPRQAPEIVVVALLENGEFSKLAAPIVRDVIKAYFDKKARLALQKTQLASLSQFQARAGLLTLPEAWRPRSLQ
ncbi:MAG: penicillin-binding protein 2 [Acidobacteriota bacterium]|nr:penicillin-binding protein 2 [Acidobacteriota bacterium]